MTGTFIVFALIATGVLVGLALVRAGDDDADDDSDEAGA
jgi:hypothetical protein